MRTGRVGGWRTGWDEAAWCHPRNRTDVVGTAQTFGHLQRRLDGGSHGAPCDEPPHSRLGRMSGGTRCSPSEARESSPQAAGHPGTVSGDRSQEQIEMVQPQLTRTPNRPCA